MPSTNITAALDLLGYRMKDKISGQIGVVTSVCFDLYGCIQATLHAGIGPDGKILETYWFDVARLDRVDDQRVMELPAFADVGGPAEKPSRAP